MLLGITLIAAGFIFNKFVVEILIADFSPDWTRDNSIASFRGNAAIISLQMSLISMGALFIVKRPQLRITWKMVTLTSGAVIFTVIAIEVFLLVWMANFASVEDRTTYGNLAQVTRDNSLAFSSDRYLGFVPTRNYTSVDGNRHNSLGFRGDEIAVPKPRGTYRIAMIGGSTTYGNGTGTDYTKSYPYRLEETLNGAGYDFVEVINAGVPSYSTWESLINFQFRVLDLEPDLIVIYHGSTDLIDRFVLPFDAYTGDNAGSRADLLREQHSAWDVLLVTRMARQSLGFRTQEKWLRTYKGVSTNVWLEYSSGRREWQVQSWLGYLPQESSGSSSGKVSAEQIVTQNSPEFFERNIRNMIATGQAQGIPVVIMTFAFSADASDQEVIRSDLWATETVRQNHILRQVCDSTPAFCFDFAREFPADTELWNHDGVHLNQNGARLKAKLVGDFISESGFLDAR